MLWKLCFLICKRDAENSKISIVFTADLGAEEIVSLERLSDGHIDHPQNFSKDQADAVCGSLFLASEFAEEYSYDYGENLETSLDVNVADSDDYKKHQMIASFEEELTKIYFDISAAEAVVAQQKKQEYETYRNIMDGIIIL